MVDICENTVSIDELQEQQGCHEEFSVISSKKCITVDLTVTSASYSMSFYNTDDELVVTRATIETSKP